MRTYKGRFTSNIYDKNYKGNEFGIVDNFLALSWVKNNGRVLPTPNQILFGIMEEAKE